MNYLYLPILISVINKLFSLVISSHFFWSKSLSFSQKQKFVEVWTGISYLQLACNRSFTTEHFLEALLDIPRNYIVCQENANQLNCSSPFTNYMFLIALAILILLTALLSFSLLYMTDLTCRRIVVTKGKELNHYCLQGETFWEIEPLDWYCEVSDG